MANMIRFPAEFAIKNSHDISTSIAMPTHNFLCYNPFPPEPIL